MKECKCTQEQKSKGEKCDFCKKRDAYRAKKVAPRSAEVPKEKETLKLFDVPENWEDHWDGMPEYNQEKQEPVQKIIMSFRTYEDAKAFGELLEQKVTYKTKSMWYPEMVHAKFENLRWKSDEEEE